jgi:type I restriction enzyme S subunit
MKHSSYEIVPLGDVLHLDLNKELVDDSKDYEMVGVLSFGRGLFIKGILNGGSTTYKNFYRLSSEHIVMSQLFGWEGAIALSNDDFAERYVSTQFPTFLVDSTRLNRQYLGWWLRQMRVWNELKGKSKGMGDRRRTLNPNALLSCSISMPDLEIQDTISSKIDSLNSNIKKITLLREVVEKNTKALLISMSHRNDLSKQEKLNQGWKPTILGDVLTQVSNPVNVELGTMYPHFGIYSFAKGLFAKPPLDGSVIKAKKLYQVKAGQFIYGRLNAYEGAFGVISDELDGAHVSNEFPIFECDTQHVLPEFLLAYFSTPVVWEDLKRKVTGIGGGAGNRRIRLKEAVLLLEEVMLPPLEWQQKIKDTTAKLASVKTEREAVTEQLEALLPSILDKAFKGEL